MKLSRVSQAVVGKRDQVDTPRRKKTVVIKECRMRQKSCWGDERSRAGPLSSHSPAGSCSLFLPSAVMWSHLIFIVFSSPAPFSDELNIAELNKASCGETRLGRRARSRQSMGPVLFIESDLQEESNIWLANRPGTLQIIDRRHLNYLNRVYCFWMVSN